jgi:hypothetical protein
MPYQIRGSVNWMRPPDPGRWINVLAWCNNWDSNAQIVIHYLQGILHLKRLLHSVPSYDVQKLQNNLRRKKHCEPSILVPLVHCVFDKAACFLIKRRSAVMGIDEQIGVDSLHYPHTLSPSTASRSTWTSPARSNVCTLNVRSFGTSRLSPRRIFSSRKSTKTACPETRHIA